MTAQESEISLGIILPAFNEATWKVMFFFFHIVPFLNSSEIFLFMIFLYKYCVQFSTRQRNAPKAAHGALKEEIHIPELFRNGNDIENMSARVASLNAGKIIADQNTKFPIFGLLCVKLPK